MAITEKELLRVTRLKKYFPITRGLFSKTVGHVRAVDDVSFSVAGGETVGLVGESGCGKTTTGRTILRLIEPTAGEIRFEDTVLNGLPGRQMQLKRRDMQIIFQDPYSSLNPRMTIGSIVGEPMEIHRVHKKKIRRDKVKELLNICGINPNMIDRYPHEFSGGQRQRVGIARALALNPKLIIADEPVSALDVSIQAQIINLLFKLQEEFGLTYIFIAHDLAVVKHISNRVMVMYLGKIVEVTRSEDLYDHPLHPYTQALLSAIPIPDPFVQRERQLLKGDIPTPVDPPPGCRFHTRCPMRQAICKQKEPILEEKMPGHMVACHLVEKKGLTKKIQKEESH